MSLLSKLKSHHSKPMGNDEIYTEIFKTISDGNEKTMAEIGECLSGVKLYAKNHSEFYDEHNINTATGSEFALKWLGCVDILIKNGYAAEIKDDNDFDGFYEKIGSLKIVKKLNNLPAEDSIYLDYSLASWINQIDFCWSKSGLCMGGIDIGGDSSIVFVCTVEQLGKLSALADNAGRKICRAREL